MKYRQVTYNQGDGIVKVIIEDSTGKKEAVWKFNHSDKRAAKTVGRILKEKYDIDLSSNERGFFDI